MDRSKASAPDSSAAMRTAGRAAFDLLLLAAAGERREPEGAPSAGRVVPDTPLLRQPSYGGHTGGQPQTHPTPDAHFGYRSPLPQAELEPAGAGSRDLPVWSKYPRDVAPRGPYGACAGGYHELSVMSDRFHWARLLAFVSGLVNQELLLRIEYLAAENRILR